MSLSTHGLPEGMEVVRILDGDGRPTALERMEPKSRAALLEIMAALGARLREDAPTPAEDFFSETP